jgi:hypothetical protein
MLTQRRRNVAQLLLNNLHEWVPGFTITAVEYGCGTERKMRRGTAYEYRLARKPGPRQIANVFGETDAQK